MLSKKNKHYIIIDNSQKPTSFFLTPKKIIVFSISILSLCVILVFLSIHIFSDYIYNIKLTKLKKDNKELLSTIDNMENRIFKMQDNIVDLQNKDEALRTYADLPQIDRDVRQLGIGGKVIHKITKLDKFLPNDTLLISSLSRDLNKLEREIKLEKLSYEKIYNAIKNRKEQIQSTPSIKPINIGRISSYFGYRNDPFTHKRQFHYGLDFSAPTGTNVYVTADGVVGNVRYNHSYGKVIEVDHGYGYTTVYAHLKTTKLKKGQKLQRGDIVGTVGNSGRSTGPHLHYEVRKHKKKLNPLNFFFTGYLR